jgi:hypothetical protein
MSICLSFFSLFSIFSIWCKDWITTELLMNISNNWNLNQVSNHFILCIKEKPFRCRYQLYDTKECISHLNVSLEKFQKFDQMKSSLSIVNIFHIRDNTNDQLRDSLTVVLHVWSIKINRWMRVSNIMWLIFI